MTLDAKIARWVKNAIRRHPQKPFMSFADEVAALTGQKFTMWRLYDYTSRKSRLPLSLAPAICQVSGDWSLLDLVVGPHLDKLLELRAKGKTPKSGKRGKRRARR